MYDRRGGLLRQRTEEGGACSISHKATALDQGNFTTFHVFSMEHLAMFGNIFG